MSQFFASAGQSIGDSASASVLPINIQDLFPLGWIGWISLQFKGLSRVFSNTTVQKHQFQGAQGWFTGMTLRDGTGGMGREGGGRGVRMGNTRTSMADSYQCMAKTTIVVFESEVISLQLNKFI